MTSNLLFMLLVLATSLWGQYRAPRITTEIYAGQDYCHQVELTRAWTTGLGSDEQADFRNGFRKLAYRWATPDSALVSFYVEKSNPPVNSRAYSSNKFVLPLKRGVGVRPSTEQQWNSAPIINGHLLPALLPAPAVDEGVLRFRL
jgi:hypothetical protein